MARRRLVWQLYPSYLLITLVSLLAVTWYASASLKRLYYERTASDLRARARLVEMHLGAGPSLADEAQVDALCKELGKRISTRITVILPTGRVIGDTEADPARMENHADRPEIIEAFRGGVGTSSRPSPTLRQDMMYVAVPLEAGDSRIAVVRTSVPLTAIEQTLRSVQIKIVLGGALIAIFAAAVSLAVSRRISRPLEQMQRGAARFARGELNHKLPVPNSEEIGGLADALNYMAGQLHERIETITRQRSELEAVLSSMVEGVVAIDSEEHVISVNQAAAELLGINAGKAPGRSVQEVIRNSELQNLIAEMLSGDKPLERDIVLRNGAERFLSVHGTALRDAQGGELGALIVLNDVTRMRRLENVRREFVANVSHELRTPVTAIKGFAESLLDRALKDPSRAEHFLGIIAKQADRLNSIIEDLLCLSRIEQEAERAEIALEKGRIIDVLQAAVGICSRSATKKNISIDLNCDEGIEAAINAPLLEQAAANLIDNAIKYSEPGSSVQVEAAQTDVEVIIRVRDRGCGIEKEHLPRLFERFYRVDKARSRKLGGTGLGLAIVKHIAQAHGGSVDVESTPGQGSVFSIRLPKA